MKYLGTFLLIGLIGVAVFGVFGIHTMNHSDGGCPIAITRGVVCPETGNIIKSLNFHLDALRDFSLATLGGQVSAFFLFFALLALWAFLGTPFGKYLVSPSFSFSGCRYGVEQFSLPSKKKFLRWLALHENSPASF